MDPLHPITPHAPDIGPVAPAPPTRRIDPDRRREDEPQRRRRGAQAAPAEQPPPPPQDGEHPHIDIVA